MILNHREFRKKAIGYLFLFLGLLISTLLISKGLMLFSKARFEVGNQITAFLIFFISCLLYFIIVRSLTLKSMIIGTFYSISSYLISDLIIVDFIFKLETNNLEIVYFVIHLCSILTMLLIEYIVNRVKAAVGQVGNEGVK
jgi:hypothetical protein